VTLAAAAELPRQGGRLTFLRPAGWQLPLPLAFAYAAFFAAPLLMLAGISIFNDDKLTEPRFAMWAKFLGDPFYWKVIFDTLKLGFFAVCATVVVGYPLALLYMSAGPTLQRVLLFIIILPLLTSVVVRTCACCRPSSAW
jgi:putative spermidine/putrescine transport system permease protein